MKQAARRPKPAVPQARIAFFGDDVVQILSQFGERFAQGVVNVFGNERVGQRPPHQEFHGEVIDAAQVFTAQIAGGLQPAFGGKITHGKQGSVQPVGFGRFRRRAAETEDEFVITNASFRLCTSLPGAR